MKKKFAKSAVLVGIMLTLSPNLFAQELSLKDMKEQLTTADEKVVIAQQVDTPKDPAVTLSEAPEKIKESDISQVSQLDKLTNQATQGTIELQILNQQVERKKLELILKEDVFQQRLEAAMDSLTKQFMEKEEAYINEINSLKGEIVRQRQISEDVRRSATASKNQYERTDKNVFVTNIVGVGSNLSASVYYEDKIVEVREGMAIYDGLQVKEIRSNGVVFSDNDREVFVALTNESYAFSETFNKRAIKMAEASMSQYQRAK